MTIRQQFATASTKGELPTIEMSADELEKTFVAENGDHAWNESWQSLLSLSPELFLASVNLRGIPKRKGHQHLSPKVQALIALAVDSASTHLYTPGIREHIQSALNAGATKSEIIEVLELTSTLGIHACNIGVPLLFEVLREENHPAAQAAPFDDRQERLKAEFTKNRGHWHTFWEDFLRLDPDFFEAYLDFSSVPWTKKTEHGDRGALEPKVLLRMRLDHRFPETSRLQSFRSRNSFIARLMRRRLISTFPGLSYTCEMRCGMVHPHRRSWRFWRLRRH